MNTRKNGIRFVIIIFYLILLSSPLIHGTETEKTLKIIDSVLNDRNSFFFMGIGDKKTPPKELPIGIFDSGTGGLTVMDVILKLDKFCNPDHSPLESGDGELDFSKEYFIYLGDQANMPYGMYSKEKNSKLLREHIIKDTQFLLGNKYYQTPQSLDYQTQKSSVKAIVIACNTATAFGKQDIEGFLLRSGRNIKVIGVIGAGIRGALNIFKDGRSGSMGIFATLGTVNSKGYLKSLNRQQANYPGLGKVTPFQQPGIGLAGAIDNSNEYIDYQAGSPRRNYKGPSLKNPEAKINPRILNRYLFNWSKNALLFTGSPSNPKVLQLNSIDNYISYHLVSLLEKIKAQNTKDPLRTIILGCTHYPYFRNTFKKKLTQLYNYREGDQYIYRPLMAKNITLIDPADNTARELYLYLFRQKLFNSSRLEKSEFFISVPNIHNSDIQLDPRGNFTYEYKYGRRSGHIQEYVKRVPFSRGNIPASTILRIKEKIPFIYTLIKAFHYQNPKTRFLKPAMRF